MSEPERRTRGVVRISIDSIVRALYGNTDYEAVSMRVSKTDKRMLEITVSHPDLPEWRPGKYIKRIEIKRTYEQTKE